MPLFASVDLISLTRVDFTLLNRGQLILSDDPPLLFYTLSAFYLFLKPFFPANLINLMTSSTFSITPSAPLSFYAFNPNVSTLVFLFKVPYLTFDIVTAIAMLWLQRDSSHALFSFKLWMLNPVSIYVSYMMGQFDVIMLGALMTGLVFVKFNKQSHAALMLGLAGALKVLGFVIFIPLLIMWTRGTKSTPVARCKRFLWLGFMAVLPYALTILVTSFIPKYYEPANLAVPAGSNNINGFFGTVFYNRGTVANPLLAGLFTLIFDYSVSAKTYSSFIDVIYYVPILYCALVIAFAYLKSWNFDRIMKAFVIFLLLYYSFALFHPQWFLWAQPFLIILVASDTRRYLKPYLALILLYFIYVWYWGAALTTNLLFPIIPQSAFWPAPIDALNTIGLDGVKVVNLFRAFLTTVCLFTALLIVRSELTFELRWKQNE